MGVNLPAEASAAYRSGVMAFPGDGQPGAAFHHGEFPHMGFGRWRFLRRAKTSTFNFVLSSSWDISAVDIQGLRGRIEIQFSNLTQNKRLPFGIYVDTINPKLATMIKEPFASFKAQVCSSGCSLTDFPIGRA